MQYNTKYLLLLNMKLRIIVIFFLLFHYNSYECQKDSVNTKRLYFVSGTLVTGTTTSLVLLNEVWYKNYPRSNFHSFNDSKEWLQMDKVGHAMTSYYIGYAINETYRWTGLDRNKSIIYGSLTSLAYLSGLEILDGFSQAWGFSWSDMLANSLGTALFTSQELFWNEQRIKLKFSAHKTPLARYRPNVLGSNTSEQLLKDYNGQTYWLSLNIKDFLKEDTNFPSWINLALGYGANGMIGGHFNDPAFCNGDPNCLSLKRIRQYYLSFDVDLTKIKWERKFLSAFFGTIGYIKLPFPTLEFSKNKTNYYWAYF